MDLNIKNTSCQKATNGISEMAFDSDYVYDVINGRLKIIGELISKVDFDGGIKIKYKTISENKYLNGQLREVHVFIQNITNEAKEKRTRKINRLRMPKM